MSLVPRAYDVTAEDVQLVQAATAELRLAEQGRLRDMARVLRDLGGGSFPPSPRSSASTRSSSRSGSGCANSPRTLPRRTTRTPGGGWRSPSPSALRRPEMLDQVQAFDASSNDAPVRHAAGMEEKKYVCVRKYRGRALERDMTYAVTYHRSRFGDDPPRAAVYIRPWEPRDDRNRCTSTSTILRLNRVRLPAGTAVSDAVTLLALAVPAPYRDLWHSVFLDERHSAEWEGERSA